jgi:hypothetical protein
MSLFSVRIQTSFQTPICILSAPLNALHQLQTKYNYIHTYTDKNKTKSTFTDSEADYQD